MTVKNHGLAFLILALLAFTGLGLELVLGLGLEPLLFGKQFADYTALEIVIHWCLTCIVWVAVAYTLLRRSKLFGLNPFDQKERLSWYNWLIALLLLSISIAISVWDWNGLKIFKEFEYNGLFKFIFQYIYYFVEAVLVLLIIIFGQHAGELWFKKSKFPWGGILVALTWGLVHSLTKGDLFFGLIILFSI